MVQSQTTDYLAYPELRVILLGMAEINQAVRKELIGRGLGNLDSLDMVRQRTVDDTNVRLLSKMVDEYGWPTRGMVGQDGVDAAFLIIQHASHSFRKTMLPHVKKAYDLGDLSSGDYALLIDLVLVGDGYPQRFGTQAEIRNNRLIILPIEDQDRVDERRAALGLEPLALYVEKLEALYGLRSASIP